MKIQVAVFWVVTPCSDVVEYQGFRGPCCLQVVKTEAAGSTKTSAPYHITTRRHNPEDRDLNTTAMQPLLSTGVKLGLSL